MPRAATSEPEVEVTTRFTNALSADLSMPASAQRVPDDVRRASDSADAVKVARDQAWSELRAAETGLERTDLAGGAGVM